MLSLEDPDASWYATSRRSLRSSLRATRARTNFSEAHTALSGAVNIHFVCQVGDHCQNGQRVMTSTRPAPRPGDGLPRAKTTIVSLRIRSRPRLYRCSSLSYWRSARRSATWYFVEQAGAATRRLVGAGGLELTPGNRNSGPCRRGRRPLAALRSCGRRVLVPGGHSYATILRLHLLG